MLRPNKLWFRVALALFVVGVAFLIIPPYKQYCENDYANQYACAVYEGVAFVVSLTQEFNGAITAIATACIAGFTYTIYKINRSQLRYSHQIERAYISGGGAPDARLVPAIQGRIAGGMLVQVPELTGNFRVDINNYGKTAGELLEIAVGFCDVNSIPATPVYRRRPLHTWLAPGARGIPIDVVPVPTDRPATAVYGRFFYRDIFGRKWSCGFVQSINMQTGETAHIRAPAGYTGDRAES